MGKLFALAALIASFSAAAAGIGVSGSGVGGTPSSLKPSSVDVTGVRAFSDAQHVIRSISSGPAIELKNTSGPTNQKAWEFRVSTSGVLTLAPVQDSDLEGGAAITIPSSNGNVGSMTVSGGNGGITFSGGGGVSITGSGLISMGACGTSPAVAGTKSAMAVTVGTGGVATSCTVNFTFGFANPPVCVASNGTDKVAYSVTSTTTLVTVNAAAAFTAASRLNIICFGI